MLVWWIPVGGVLGFWHYKTLLKPDSKHFVMEIPKNHIAFRWLEKNKREHHPCKPPTNHWLWSMQKTRNKKNTNLNQQPTIDWPNQDFRLSIVVGISFEMLKCSFRLYLFLTQNSKKKRNVFFPTTKRHQKKPLTTDLFYFSTSGRRRSQPFRTSSGSNNRSRWRHMASGEVPRKPPKPLYNWIGFDLFPLNQKKNNPSFCPLLKWMCEKNGLRMNSPRRWEAVLQE